MSDTEQVPWRVFEHGPLETLTDNIWRVEGSIPRMALRRQMVVARAHDGRLLIHNGVSLGEDEMKRIEAWGEPTWLVVPNGFHRMDARAFKARYPSLQVLAPSGARKRVEQVVAIDHAYDAVKLPDGMRLTHLRGVNDAEGVLEIESNDGATLVFNDAFFNQPHMPGLFGAAYKMMGQSGKPKVTMLAKMMLVKSKRDFAAHLTELAATTALTRVVPGHGTVISEDAAATLATVATELA